MKSLAVLSALLPAILAQYGEEYGCGNDTVFLPATTSTVTVILESTADAAGVTPSATSAVTIVDSDSTARDDVFYYVIRNGTTSWIGSTPFSQNFQTATTVTSTVTVSEDTSVEVSPLITENPSTNATSDEITTTSRLTSFVTRRVTITSFSSNSSATASGSTEVDAAGASGAMSNETEVADVETETLTSEDFASSAFSGEFNATILTASTTQTGDAVNATTDDGSTEVAGLGGSRTMTETPTMAAYGGSEANETSSNPFTTSCSPSVVSAFSSGSITSPSSTVLVCVITAADGAMPLVTGTSDTAPEDMTTSTAVPFANSTLLTLTVGSASVSETPDITVAGSTTVAGLFANQSSSDTAMMTESLDVEPTETTADTEPTEGCGEWGNFTLSWDDEPVFTPEDNATAPYPPVFNPYHNLFFSNGYAYIPPPNSPFEASTGSRFAIFLTEEAKKDFGSRHAAGAEPGEIGAGPRMAIDAFWFNAYGAYLGCDNEGPEDCFMRISGYQWDEGRQNDTMATQQIAVISPCNQTAGCELTPVTFQDTFRQLTAIKIEAYAGGSARNWYMDDLSLGWWNNTCAAGLRRLENRL